MGSIRRTALAILVVVGAFAPRLAYAQASTTILSANGFDTITYGDTVLFTAVVESTNSVGQPGGMVVLKRGDTTLATLTLVSDGPNAASARASYQTTTADLPAGSYTMTASFPGGGGFAASSASRLETVNKYQPFVSVSATPNPSRPGDEVTFTVSVTTGGNHTRGLGEITGTVALSDGFGRLGTSESYNPDPVFTDVAAYIQTTALTDLGAVVVAAEYSGDDNNLPATSPDYTQTVRGLTNLTIEGAAMVAAGQSTPYTATATFSDATSNDVAATWSAAPAAGVSLSALGVLSTTLAASGSVVVTASYTDGAITKTATKTVAISPTLTGLGVAGRAEVAGTDSASYTATATFGDGTTAVVTPLWTVTPGTFAAIGVDGTMTTSAVVTNQFVTVTADYTFDGVTKSASEGVTIVPLVTVPDAGAVSDAPPPPTRDAALPTDAAVAIPDATPAAAPADAAPTAAARSGGCAVDGRGGARGLLPITLLALYLFCRRRS